MCEVQGLNSSRVGVAQAKPGLKKGQNARGDSRHREGGRESGDPDVGAGSAGGGALGRTAPRQSLLLLRARVPGAALTILHSVRPLLPVPSVAAAPAGAASSATRALDHLGAIFSTSQISRDLGCGLIPGTSLGGGD